VTAGDPDDDTGGGPGGGGPGGGGPGGGIPIPVGNTCPSYDPYSVNFNTVRPVPLPRYNPGISGPQRGGPGNDTSPWIYSSAGSASGPSFRFSNSAPSSSGANTETRTRSRTTTYTRTLTYRQIYRFPTSPAVTNIVSIIDPSTGQDLDIPPIRTSGSENFIYLNYQEFFINYPYDVHNPQIIYQIGYERYQRQGTITQTSSRTQSVLQTRTRANSTSSYGSWSGSLPSIPEPNFSAPSTTIGSATVTNNDLTTYGGRRTSINPDISGLLEPLPAPEMPPCFPREYTADPSPVDAEFINGSDENPSGSRFTFELPLELTYSEAPTGGLRTATIVNDFEYEVEWYSEGVSGDRAYSGSRALSADLTNTNTSNNVEVSVTPTFQEVSASINFRSDENLQAGDRICWILRVVRPTAKIKSGRIRGQTILPNNSTPIETDPECTPAIYDSSYAKFYGNDIFAGGGFGSQCSINDGLTPVAIGSSSIVADYQQGASSELAVFAVNTIRGIHPGNANNASVALDEITRLAFSNDDSTITRNLSSGTFGGGFDHVLCSEDWWGNREAASDLVVASTDTNNVLNLESYNDRNASGRYIVEPTNSDQPVIIRSPNPIQNGANITIYADGDVVLADNIRNQSNSWNNAADIPGVYIIARGNIYISSDVTELNGVFVAQPDDDDLTPRTYESSGYIDTCYDVVNMRDLVDAYQANPSATGSFLSAQCNSKLTVTGSVVAKSIELLRTRGTVSLAPQNEPQSSNNIAEVFQFNPLLYYNDGSEGVPRSSDPSNVVQFDSIRSLPPAF